MGLPSIVAHAQPSPFPTTIVVAGLIVLAGAYVLWGRPLLGRPNGYSLLLLAAVAPFLLVNLVGQHRHATQAPAADLVCNRPGGSSDRAPLRYAPPSPPEGFVLAGAIDLAPARGGSACWVQRFVADAPSPAGRPRLDVYAFDPAPHPFSSEALLGSQPTRQWRGGRTLWLRFAADPETGTLAGKVLWRENGVLVLLHATGQAADEALRLADTVRVIDQRRAGGQRIATASPPGFRLVRQGRPHEWTVAGARTSRLLYVDRARILRRGDEIALAAERQVSIETTQRRTVPDDQWAESARGRRVELPSGVGYLFSERRPGGQVPAPEPGDGGPAPGSLTAIVLRPRPDCLIVLQGRGLTDAQLLDLAASLRPVSPTEWSAIASSGSTEIGPPRRPRPG
jgi:hypothetical protein